MQRNRLIFAAVLLGIVVFVAGMAAYPLLFSSQRGSSSENLPIGGYFIIGAYHHDGTEFASWEGHNSLFSTGINGLAQCLSGQQLPSVLGGTCTGISAEIWVYVAAIHTYAAPAKNALYPLGCNPTVLPGCTGWQARALINFSSGAFLPAPVTEVDAGPKLGSTFDFVPIAPITVNLGDYLSVTITYSIT